MPHHWVFKPLDAFSPLWKLTVVGLDHGFIVRALGITWPKLGRQQVRAKLVTTLMAGDDTGASRLARAHRDRLAARWEGMPRLPDERRARLLGEADLRGAELADSLRQVTNLPNLDLFQPRTQPRPFSMSSRTQARPIPPRSPRLHLRHHPLA